MNDLIKKMKIMEWWKTLPFQKDITLSWSEKQKSNRWATAFYNRNAIVLYSKLFDCIFEAVQHCILHEVAHFIYRERTGHSGHNQEFENIKNELIRNYGSIETAQAKMNGTIATSSYKMDAAAI